MAKTKKNSKDDDPALAYARYETSEADIAKARKWFVRATELTESKSFDFAIKCYVDGLGYWPEAVDEGHQPLRLAAYERNVRGGKKPGFAESMKYSMSGRDAKKAMLNAEWLLSHDPPNVSYLEGILKNANKLHCEDTIQWIAPIYKNGIESEKKLSAKRFALLREVCEEAGDRAASRKESSLAVEFYECAAEALRVQRQADPKDLTLENELRDLSTKLTILKGKYESAETFQESMRDADRQRDIHDRERMVQSDESLNRLIAGAQREVEENPDNVNKIYKLVDLLCSREDEEEEGRAIGFLVEKYKELGDYRCQQRAEDIRIKQVKRVYRRLRDAGDREEAKRARDELLTLEIRVLGERIKHYPTDNRLKFDYGTRLFQANKIDEAIPQLQAARADGKVRMQSDLYLGRCFYAKEFHAQAIGTLTQAVQSYEIADDATGKELRYWLARSLEADGRGDEARDTYGGILQMDYNFRDVRDRLERLTGS